MKRTEGGGAWLEAGSPEAEAARRFRSEVLDQTQQ